MTEFGNQKASHYILSSQQWSLIEWWISNARYSKQASVVLNILSSMTGCGSRGEKGVLNVLEFVREVGT